LLCGGTSGVAVVAAVKLAKQLQLGPGKTMLVILPDSIRDYITKVKIFEASTHKVVYRR
jgi:cystathionine beta-synthase